LEDEEEKQEGSWRADERREGAPRARRWQFVSSLWHNWEDDGRKWEEETGMTEPAVTIISQAPGFGSGFATKKPHHLAGWGF